MRKKTESDTKKVILQLIMTKTKSGLFCLFEKVSQQQKEEKQKVTINCRNYEVQMVTQFSFLFVLWRKEFTLCLCGRVILEFSRTRTTREKK